MENNAVKDRKAEQRRNKKSTKADWNDYEKRKILVSWNDKLMTPEFAGKAVDIVVVVVVVVD